MPEVDLFGDNNVPQGTELYDKRIGKIQAEIHNYLRQGVVPPAIQQVLNKLDNISVDADTVNLNTDQLEAKLDTLNGLLTTLQTDTALVKASASNIDLDIGSPSETAASTDTSTSGIIGLLKRLLQRITTLIYPPFSSGSFDNSGTTSAAIDCAGYDYLVQHVTGGGGGYTRPIQWSNDGTNWTSSGPAFGTYYYYGSNGGWETLQGNMGTSSGLFVFPVLGRYWRIATGGSGGGSWTHRWYLHRGPLAGILEDSIGSKISSAAVSDTDNTGLIGLFKRLLQRITTLIPANLTVSSTRLLVDGSGVTQPVSQSTAANLKGQFQILNSAGSAVVAPAEVGTAGSPSIDVLSVQGVSSGTPLAVRPRNGSITRTTGTTSGTANTSTQALASNTDRQYLLIQNISDTDMYFNFGAAATTSNLLIAKNGGGIVFESGYVPTDAVNVICSAASKSFFILSA